MDALTFASGGSRGDFVTVDPTNDTLLLDSDRPQGIKEAYGEESKALWT